MGKKLAKIALFAGLALATAGCYTENSKYDFSGRMGKDSVTFTNKIPFLGDNSNPENYLTVRKLNGDVIIYKNKKGDNLKLNELDITKDGKVTRYYPGNDVDQPVIDSAQTKFYDYLKKIKEKKIKQGLEALR